MKCQICTENESKYKCPTCMINYCGLVCYKSESHKHDETRTEPELTIDDEIISDEINHSDLSNTSFSTAQIQLFTKIIEDDIIKQFLQEDTLQFHLSVLIKILHNHNNIIEPKAVNDTRMVMNLKLLNLRLGGIEENELVEEFVQRILFLINQG